MQNDENNVTLRRRRKQLLRSKSTDSLSSDSSLNKTYTRSLDLSTGLNSNDFEEMKLELLHTKDQLEIIRNELDNVICENNQLKDTIARQQRHINTLKDLCKSPLHPRTGQLLSVKKRSRYSFSNYSRVLSLDYENKSTNDSLLNSHIENSKVLSELSTLDENSKSYKNLSPDNLLQIKGDSTSKQPSYNPVICSETFISKPPLKDTKMDNKQTQTEFESFANQLNHRYIGSKHKTELDEEVIRKDHRRRRKLSILSNCNYTASLDIIENTFGKHFEYCHYLLRNCSIKEIVSNILKKAQSFNIDDYIIIMIGEQDFRNMEDATVLVKIIRETLNHITHTNIILCCPTYILGAPIHNYKVEMFSRLLCLDIETHKYAYFIDSNSDLSYETFSRSTGKINKLGLKRIYEGIFRRLLVDIKNYPIDSDYDNLAKMPENSLKPLFRSAT